MKTQCLSEERSAKAGPFHGGRAARAIAAILVVCVLGATTTCTSYQARTLVPDDRLPLDQKNIVLLHRGGLTYHLTGPRFSGAELTGMVADMPTLNTESRQYELHLYLRSEFSQTLSQRAEVAIPLDMISEAVVYDIDLRKTVVNTSILTTVLTLVGLSFTMSLLSMIMLASSGSCPFVYAENGEELVLAGEAYPGAVQPALARHDYLRLAAITPRGGQFRLRMSNELREIEHTDLAELVVCDHPTGTSVFLDGDGGAHTVSDPIAPVRGVDGGGNNILGAIGKKDGLRVLPPVTAASDSGLSTLTLVFPRPARAVSARLLVRAKNSPWLEYCYYRFQNNFGSAFAGWQKSQKLATREELLSWKREQAIGLSVLLRRGGEWVPVGTFEEAGPFADRDMVMELDLANLPEDSLEIRLESGYLFWEIDHAAVDFSEDRAVQSTTVPVQQAGDQDTGDVTALLQADDGEHYVQHEGGSAVDILFPCPPPEDGMERTVFLHTKGYYEVVRDFSGRPDIAILQGFRNPGAFPRYSLTLFAELTR